MIRKCVTLVGLPGLELLSDGGQAAHEPKPDLGALEAVLPEGPPP